MSRQRLLQVAKPIAVAFSISLLMAAAQPGGAAAAVIDSGSKAHAKVADCTIRVKIDQQRAQTGGSTVRVAGQATCTRRHDQTVVQVSLKVGGKIAGNSKLAVWSNSYGTGSGWVWTDYYRLPTGCHSVQGVAQFWVDDDRVVRYDWVTTGAPIQACS